MVSLSDVLASNAQITTTLPKGLVAVLAGATNGIGEITLKTLVKYATAPRVYLFARNPASAERVIVECRQLNPQGQYTFIKADLSLIKDADRACEEVKRKEKLVNLVVLSAGELSLQRNLTPEGLLDLLASSTYTRIRIAQNLLPLLSTAARTTALARVINVAAAGKEGDMITSDIGALNIPLYRIRPHLASLHTLALEKLAEQAPDVSFLHDFPGAVYTNLHKNAAGFVGFLFRVFFTTVHTLLGNWMFVPIEECGERHVFFATSGRYPPREGKAIGVPQIGGAIARGSDGNSHSGVYSVGWDGEGPAKGAELALKELRKKGVPDLVWDHFIGEFERVSKSTTT
ncbi:hypothetical protein BKA66DRAFT_430165 [Pyrenochaeta sp. MPI-SDFR-AT-0127]|nr:hypothetical protein BKA66DRAFT_430165 [Pyrenochaeta sp. MPI-SDFR-AT-0127]